MEDYKTNNLVGSANMVKIDKKRFIQAVMDLIRNGRSDRSAPLQNAAKRTQVKSNFY